MCKYWHHTQATCRSGYATKYLNYYFFFQFYSIEKFHDPLYYIAANVKEGEMVSKFQNTLNNMVQEGIILTNDTEFFNSVIKSNQDWMDDNYSYVASYFGLPLPTSKFIMFNFCFILILIFFLEI